MYTVVALDSHRRPHPLRGFTLIELLVVIAIIGILAMILLPVLARVRESARRVSCASNLKEMSLAMSMYADEHQGMFPSREINNRDALGNPVLSNDMIFNGPSIFPEYLDTLEAVWCPSWIGQTSPLDRYDRDKGNNDGIIQPEELTKEPFDYTGWVILSDVQILGFAKIGQLGSGINGRWEEAEYSDTPWGELAAANVASNGLASTKDFTTTLYPGTQNEGNTMYRLRHGIERYMITDINNMAASVKSSTMVPVMWDHISTKIKDFAHIPGGANVLYLDGHVEFKAYPGPRFPMTEDSARIFGRYNRPFDG